MTINQLRSKLDNALHGSLADEAKVVLTVAAILFTANLAYSAYTVGFTNGQAFEISRDYTVSGDSTFLIRLRIATSLGLFVCVAGLALRRLGGVLASMVGIIWFVLIYGWWRYKSMAFLRNLEVSDFTALPNVSHFAGLRGASFWDLLALIIAAIIFIWEVVTIFRVLKSPDDVFRSSVISRPG